MRDALQRVVAILQKDVMVLGDMRVHSPTAWIILGFVAGLLSSQILFYTYETPVEAGLGGSVVPSFPTPAVVGDIKTATITITNHATTPNTGENVNVSGIFLTPSCAKSDGFSCITPDPGVFQFATAIGKVGTACASIVFSQGAPNATTGEFELVPSQSVTLGPASGAGPLPSKCVISVNYRIVKAPQDSTPPNLPLTTESLAHATLQGASSLAGGMASGVTLTAIPTTTGQSNQKHVPKAGPDQNVQVSIPVSFDGSASYDPDGSIVSYLWNFGDGSTTGGVSASHTYATAGIYTATLLVTDNAGATSTDSAIIQVINTSNALQWTKKLSPMGDMVVNAVSTDRDGNVVVTGDFWGTINLGGGTTTSAGAADIFVAKYTPSGTYLWSKRFGGTYDDSGKAVALDASGNVYIGGSFKKTADFGGGPVTAYEDSFNQGYADGFIAKYSPTGTYAWAKTFGSYSNDGVTGLGVDVGGNVTATGYFVGLVNFSGTSLQSASDIVSDIFVAKYSGGGQLSWAKRFGDTGADAAYGLALDPSGNIFITGMFSNRIDFGGGALTDAGSGDIFLAKLNSGGTYIWAKRFGDTGKDVGYAVATDPNGNVVITGYFQGVANFGGAPFTSYGLLDTFVAKYSPAGAYSWARQFGGTSLDEGLGLAMDASGSVYLTGTFKEIADFGSGPLTSAGSLDTVIAKYSSSGATQWVKRFGDVSDDLGDAVTVDTSGNSYFGGYFNGDVNFGSGTLSSGNNTSAYLLKYSPDGGAGGGSTLRKK